MDHRPPVSPGLFRALVFAVPIGLAMWAGLIAGTWWAVGVWSARQAAETVREM